MKTFSFRAMGSQILIAQDTSDPRVSEFALQARDWFEGWEQILSRFRLSSELSTLNRFSGKPHQVSETFWEVANLAARVERQTDGLVTPLILNALEAAGYDASFEFLSEHVGELLRQPQPVLAISDAKLEFDENARRITIPAGYQVDFGGVAKGWAAHQTMLKLQHLSPVLVDAGGDIAFSGPQSDGSAWPIAVADPFNQEQNLELIMLSGGGVATSGRDYRRWMHDGRWQHHIIDPHTGAPAETDVLSVTVIAPDVMQAEACAKSALILGSQQGPLWMQEQSGVDFMMTLEDGSVIKSPAFIDYQWNEKWSKIQITP